MSDSIRRQDAIDEFETYFDHIKRIDKRGHKYIKPIELDVKEIINTLPSAEKRGKWFDVGVSARCDQCGLKNNRPTRFCPNCGADMRGAE